MQGFTIVGMHGLASLNFFTPKKVQPTKVIPLALGFVGYVVGLKKWSSLYWLV